MTLAITFWLIVLASVVSRGWVGSGELSKKLAAYSDFLALIATVVLGYQVFGSPLAK